MTFDIVLSKTLTSKQHAFASNLIEGHEKRRAAELAGYAIEHADVEAKRLLRQPAIMAMVQIGIAQRLARCAPLAVNVLEDLVRDTTMHPKLRLDAAKAILDRSGHIAPKAVAASSSAVKPLNEMSMTELRELADKLEDELSGRAKDVSSATAAPVKAQSIDDIM